MILTGVGLENLGSRTRGLQAAFKECGVEVVDVVNDHLDPNSGHPGVFCFAARLILRST